MYTPEMLASMKKVEANRAANIAYEPRRLTAEEKEQLLRDYHPDYRPEGFTEIKVGRVNTRTAHESLCELGVYELPFVCARTKLGILVLAIVRMIALKECLFLVSRHSFRLKSDVFFTLLRYFFKG